MKQDVYDVFQEHLSHQGADPMFQQHTYVYATTLGTTNYEALEPTVAEATLPNKGSTLQDCGDVAYMPINYQLVWLICREELAQWS